VKVVQSNSLFRGCVSSAVALVAILTAVVVLSPAAFAQFTNNYQTNTISGVVIDWEDDYIFDHQFCQLQVINAGALSNFYGYMGYVVGASNDSAVVSGSGSLWYNDGYLYVGYNGAGNQLVISNGGVVYNSPNGYVGYNGASPSNTVLVTGTGSVWSNLTGLYVGNNGAGNQLVISNGGAVYSSSGFIGYTSASNNVSVTGAGSVWRNSGSLCVGYNASSVSNKLTVSGGALYVTNGSSNAVLDVRRGTLTLNSGTVTVDRLTLTNASSVITFNSGVLITKSTTVSNGVPFMVGDGTSAATLNLAGGTHSFVNGLAITNNAVLAGTGTINSNVTLAGILSPGSSPGTITNSGNLTLQPGAVLNFDLGTNSDLVVVNGNLTLGGTLNVSDSGGFTNGTYTLFSYGGTLTTNGSSSILTIGTTPNANWNYTVDISSNGYVHLIVAGAVSSCTPPWANFTANTTTGAANLQVIFTDNSTGTITSVSCTFGDGGTTNFTAPTTVTYTYTNAGVYTVTQVAYSGSCGTSTNTQSNLIKVLTAWEAWQQQYFGCIGCPQAAGDVDYDGDGVSNTNEFLAGTDPTSSASAFRITSITPQGKDLRITWTTGSGKTNALQVTSGDANGSYSTNNFTDLFIVTNTVGTVSNYLDAGALTNAPSRFYRVRLVP